MCKNIKNKLKKISIVGLTIPVTINIVITYFSIKDRSTLFCLHWEMKGHGSKVNLVKREAKTFEKSMSMNLSVM